MDFAGLIKYIFNLGVSLAGVLAFGVIVYSGIRLLTSAGNPAVMSESKKRIRDAFLGLGIILVHISF